MDWGMLGPALSLGLSCIGSAIGCTNAGAASHAVMSRVEEGHGKFIGMAAAPTSQMIYGFLLMYIMAGKINDGDLSPWTALAIGLFAGTTFMLSAIYQGEVCVTGIQTSAEQPSAFGKCFAAIGIVESTALFAFVFSLLIM